MCIVRSAISAYPIRASTPMATSPLPIPLNVTNTHHAIANPFVPEVLCSETHNLIFSKLLKEKLPFWNPEPYFVTASFGCLESIRNCKTTEKKSSFLFIFKS